jgi:hypothetical protein
MANRLLIHGRQFVRIPRTRGFTNMKKIALAAVLTLVAVGPAFSGQNPWFPPPPKDPPCYRNCGGPTKMAEPSSFALLATGLLVAGGLVLIGRKRFVTE